MSLLLVNNIWEREGWYSQKCCLGWKKGLALILLLEIPRKTWGAIASPGSEVGLSAADHSPLRPLVIGLLDMSANPQRQSFSNSGVWAGLAFFGTTLFPISQQPAAKMPVKFLRKILSGFP